MNKMDMSPTDIRIAMLKAGVNQSAIAKRMDVSHTMVRLVIDGLAVSHPIRTAIAEHVGLDIRRIWPSAYMFGGPRKAGRPRGSLNRNTEAA